MPEITMHGAPDYVREPALEVLATQQAIQRWQAEQEAVLQAQEREAFLWLSAMFEKMRSEIRRTSQRALRDLYSDR